jgi:hypothetical protein
VERENYPEKAAETVHIEKAVKQLVEKNILRKDRGVWRFELGVGVAEG